MKITLYYKGKVEEEYNDVIYFETKDKALEIYTEMDLVDKDGKTKTQLLFSSIALEPAHTRLDIDMTGYYDGLLQVLEAQIKCVKDDINFDEVVVQEAKYSGEHVDFSKEETE